MPWILANKKRIGYATQTLLWALAVLAAGNAVPRGLAQRTAKSEAAANTLFAPLQQWKVAILNGDAAALRALYSTDPAVQVEAPSGRISPEADVAFWMGLKPRKLRFEISEADGSQSGLQEIVFHAEIRSLDPSDKQVLYVTAGQVWKRQSPGWRLVLAKRTDPTRLQQPDSLDKQIYETGANARADIQHGLELASEAHKRVLLIFGANWCYDCHVLDMAFHRPEVAAVLARDYEVVHVDIGQGEKNQDVMRQYDVPMKKGIPAIAVLDAKGKLLFSQKNGEFNNARALAPEDVMEFLRKWKG